MGEAWALCESNAAVIIATWREVVITQFRGVSSVADIEALRRVSATLAHAHPDGIAHLNIVMLDGDTRATIDEDMRSALRRLLSDPEVPLRASSVVYPGAGVGRAFVRSILGGLVLLTRSRAKIRFHASLEEGATWLAETMAGRFSSAELIRVASSLDAPEGFGEPLRGSPS